MTEELARAGNASSLHTSGRRARRVVEESREQLAAAARRRPERGRLHGGRHRGGQPRGQGPVLGPPRGRRAPQAGPRVSAVEHHAVLDPVEWLAEHEGAEVGGSPSTRDGRVDRRGARATRLERARTTVALVTVMWANNEVGTIQPVERGRRGRPRASGSRCTATPSRRSASCRLDFAATRARRADRERAQARRPDRRRRAAGAARARPHPGRCTAAARSAASGPAPSTSPPVRGVRRRRRGTRSRRRRRARGRGWRGCATSSSRAVLAAVPDAVLRGDPDRRGPAAGQRPLHLPRLRGRLAAVPARRPRGRVLDRARPARPACRSPATCCWRWASETDAARGALRFSLGCTVDRRPTSTPLAAAIGPVVERARRAGLASRRDGPAVAARREGPRRDERRGRLRRRGRAGRRRRARRRRRPPGAGPRPRDRAHRSPRLLHGRGRPRRPPRRRRPRHPVLRVGPRRSGSRRDVVDDFVAEYAAGRTPEPVRAVQRADQVLGAARQGARARLRRRLHRALRAASTSTRHDGPTAAPGGRPRQGPVLRARGPDPERLRARDLPARRTRAKADVRARGRRARAAGGGQARLARHLLRRRRRHQRLGWRSGWADGPAPILDAGGGVLGEHEGAYAYTVGQRHGLRLGRPAADGRPRYVLEVGPVTNTVVVGPREALEVDVLEARGVTWCGPSPGGRRPASAPRCGPTATSSPVSSTRFLLRDAGGTAGRCRRRSPAVRLTGGRAAAPDDARVVRRHPCRRLRHAHDRETQVQPRPRRRAATAP